MAESIITPAGTSVLDELDLDPAFIAKAKLAIGITISIAEMGLRNVKPPRGCQFHRPNCRSSPAASSTTSARLSSKNAPRPSATTW